MAISTVCELLRAIKGILRDNMHKGNAKKRLSRQKKDDLEAVTCGRLIG